MNTPKANLPDEMLDNIAEMVREKMSEVGSNEMSEIDWQIITASILITAAGRLAKKLCNQMPEDGTDARAFLDRMHEDYDKGFATIECNCENCQEDRREAAENGDKLTTANKPPYVH